MSRAITLRLASVEAAMAALPRARKPVNWRVMCMLHGATILAAYGRDAEPSLDTLYYAISLAHYGSDAASPIRADLRTRFEWAAWAAERLLGGKDGLRGIIARPEVMATVQRLALALDRLPFQHPELVLDSKRPRQSVRYMRIGEDKQLHLDSAIVEGLPLAAFGIETWADAQSAVHRDGQSQNSDVRQLSADQSPPDAQP